MAMKPDDRPMRRTRPTPFSADDASTCMSVDRGLIRVRVRRELKHCAHHMLRVLPTIACQSSDVSRTGLINPVHISASEHVLLLMQDQADLGSKECALRLLNGRVEAKAPVNLCAPSGLQLHGMIGPESWARKLQACSGGIQQV